MKPRISEDSYSSFQIIKKTPNHWTLVFLTDLIDLASSDFIIYMPVSQCSRKNEKNGFFRTEVRAIWNTRAFLLAPGSRFAVFFPGDFCNLGSELPWQIILVPKMTPSSPHSGQPHPHALVMRSHVSTADVTTLRVTTTFLPQCREGQKNPSTMGVWEKTGFRTKRYW